MSLYSKVSIGFGPGFGVGEDVLFNDKPNTSAGDFKVIRSDTTTAPELVTNGSFATDSDWVKDACWSIAGGVAVSDGTGGDISQALSLTEGYDYFVKVTTSGGFYANNGLQIQLGNNTYQAKITADGSYIFRLTAGASSNLVFHAETSAFIGNIDNVSVKSADFNYSATRIDANGFIKGERPNVPRATYPIGGSDNGCPYLILEPAVRNIALQSEALNTSPWSQRSLTVTENYDYAPSGLLTASLLVPTGSGIHNINQGYSGAASNWIYSFFAKIPTGSTIKYVTVYPGAADADANFDIETGAITTDTNVVSAWTEDYSGGWLRCFVKYDNAITTDRMRLYASSGPLGASITTETSGDGILIWGCSVVESTSEGFYVPTMAGLQQKEVDLVNNAGEAADFNTTEGVLYANIAALQNDLTTRAISVSSGASTDAITIKYNTVSNQIQAEVFSSLSLQAQLTYDATDIKDFHKVAIRYKANAFSLWVNGVEVATDTSGNTPASLIEMSFDSGGGSDVFIGKCKELLYFSEYLSDVELTTLTTL